MRLLRVENRQITSSSVTNETSMHVNEEAAVKDFALHLLPLSGLISIEF
jgi:hypothetical protein